LLIVALGVYPNFIMGVTDEAVSCSARPFAVEAAEANAEAEGEHAAVTEEQLEEIEPLERLNCPVQAEVHDETANVAGG
jgi:hypothetical protein